MKFQLAILFILCMVGNPGAQELESRGFNTYLNTSAPQADAFLSGSVAQAERPVPFHQESISDFCMKMTFYAVSIYVVGRMRRKLKRSHNPEKIEG